MTHGHELTWKEFDEDFILSIIKRVHNWYEHAKAYRVGTPEYTFRRIVVVFDCPGLSLVLASVC